MAATEFPLFPSLPAELRNQIWRDALPDKIRRPLYFYKKGCWCPRYITATDPKYSYLHNAEHDDYNDDYNRYFLFYHEKLDCVNLELPLFFVNHEAHAIALRWIHEQGLKIRFYTDDQESFLVMRPFNPLTDTLYVPSHKWDEINFEPFNRMEEPDIFGRSLRCDNPDFTRLALPEALFQKYPDSLHGMFHWYSNVGKLYVIFNAPPDLLPEDGSELQRRWELEGTEQVAFFWNNSLQKFEWRDREYIRSDTMQMLIERECRNLSEELIYEGVQSFEILTAFVVIR